MHRSLLYVSVCLCKGYQSVEVSTCVTMSLPGLCFNERSSAGRDVLEEVASGCWDLTNWRHLRKSGRFCKKKKSFIDYIYNPDSERFDHTMICVCVPIVLIELLREVCVVLKKPMRVCCNPEVQQSRLRGFRAPPYFCCLSQCPPLSSRKLGADIAHSFTTIAGTDGRKSL